MRNKNQLRILQIHLCRDDDTAYIVFMRDHGIANFSRKGHEQVLRLVTDLVRHGYVSVTSNLDCGPGYTFVIEYGFWNLPSQSKESI